MGKNYTIYIKCEQIKYEANKSGLINSLLEKHYDKAEEKQQEDDAAAFKDRMRSVDSDPTYSPPENVA